MTIDLTPRPTTYRGVRMRSRLEAAWAEQFDAFKWLWEYEPRCFASEDGQYLPDFYVIDSEGTDLYVEVKPAISREQVGQVLRDSMRWARILRASAATAHGLIIAIGSNGDAATGTAHLIHRSIDRDTSPGQITFLNPATPPVPSLHAAGWTLDGTI